MLYLLDTESKYALCVSEKKPYIELEYILSRDRVTIDGV
jgi:hypothetical protein